MKNVKSFRISSSYATAPIMCLLIFLVLIVLSCPCSMGQDNSLAQFDSLKQPKISNKKDQKMLVVEAKGDPEVVGGKAFSLLFRLYFSSPETPKNSLQFYPCARWPESLDTPQSEWIGLYALPVPENMIQLPHYDTAEGLKASLVAWEYGEVAEILHVGPYDKEEPTVKRLREYINDQGYEVVGGHEEEYIVGPTMYGKGDPEKYETIIRYRIRKPDKK